MQDFFTGEKITTEIDYSIFSISDAQNSPNKQRRLIEEWIEVRGNQKHNTTLELISWTTR